MMIREATRDDAEWVLHHRLGMFRAMGEPKEFIEETSVLTKGYLEGDWTRDYRYFLVEDKKEVIGGCGLSTFRLPPMVHQKTGIYTYLSNMFIEPEYQSKGIGRALLKHVIEVCKNENIGLIILHASVHGSHLFRSEGFSGPEHLMHLLTLKHRRE
ncbi:MAG: N-acetyltransferase family protein [Candidatus Thorarchaeota archaeon]|jgi:GNAT superfamily N-acetyltransferase